jgi:ABC-type dipeptide/oligopeptide/nickel transport system ATPase component
MNSPTTPMLDIRDLRVGFSSDHGITPALHGVSLRLDRGETLAIVGESGSGKSVTALSITQLLPQPPTIYQGGEIIFEGEDLLKASPARLRRVRGGKIAYIFQEPSTSLNPVYTIGSQIEEMIRLHRADVGNVEKEIIYWLDAVGIPEPARRLHDYPHQLSGGMQQRVMIAMALSARPDLLIADEPTTALDVTIQAQILDKLRDLQKELGMAVLLITHNFAIIRGLARHVAVMYRGKVVEYGETEEVLRSPQHPYTRALIACIPKLGVKQRRLPTIADFENTIIP